MPVENPVHVLLVENNPAEAERLDALLGCLPGLPTKVQRFSDISFAEVYLGSNRPALMLLGLETARPGSDELVVGLRQRHPWLPVVVIAADQSPGSAETLIRCGAQECIGQDELLPDLVARAIRHALARHAAESALRANEDLIKLVAENTTDLIAVLDRQGRRLYNSPSYARTFGAAPELAGTDSFAEIHPEDRDRIRQVFRKTLETGQGQRAEFRLQLPGGTVRWLESVGSAICNAQGQPDRVVVVSRDLTEKQELLLGLDRALEELRTLHQELQAAQRRIVEAEKREAIGTFAGAIAHDVKNTLQTLLLGIDYLRAGGTGEDAGTAGVLLEMETASRKADAAMRNLLEFAEYGPVEIKELDLNQLVNQCAEAVVSDAENRRVLLQRHLAPRLPGILVPAIRVRHVILCALIDAIQLTGAGGQVRIQTSVKGVNPISATDSAARPGTVVLEIDDEGPPRTDGDSRGSAAASRRAMLELPTLRKVVEGMGARIELSAQEPRGTRLAFMFKAELPPAAATAPIAAEPSA